MLRIIALTLAVVLPVAVQAADLTRWQNISQVLFPGVTIAEDSNTITLVTANRAEDAAIVPVDIHTRFPQTTQYYVTDIWLVIDQNPSPVAAHFMFTPQSAQADIETRVRINEYTLIRAIARTSDGRYHQDMKFIKASGGCSAPATKDAEVQGLGRIKISRLDSLLGRPGLLQTQIRHPNDSGLAFDQISRNYIPAHYVRHMKVSHDDQVIMTADLDISISENPEFRFYVDSAFVGNVVVTFTDDTEQVWSARSPNP
jgi:sulfur-oxidizing protein SoxY